MVYDFQKLKTVRCYDTVTIRVPMRWDIYADTNEAGTWGCYENNEETGTLWITTHRFALPEEGGGLPADEFKKWVESLVNNSIAEHQTDIDNSLEPMGRDYLWKRVFDGEEDGDLLRFFGYQRFQAEGNEFGFTNFNFVLLHSLLDDPEFQELINIVDREVRGRPRSRCLPHPRPTRPPAPYNRSSG